MKTSLNHYFQTEQQYLEEALNEFKDEYPQEASRLNLNAYQGRDPHIERLLDGYAYLNARTKQQIDIGLHEVGESLVRKVAPHFLSPMVSKTIVHFVDEYAHLTEEEYLAPGLRLLSQKDEQQGSPCQFITAHSIKVQPFKVTEIKLDRTASSMPTLELTFTLNEGVDTSIFTLNSINFYIDALPQVSKQWRYHLSEHVDEVLLTCGDSRQTVGTGKLECNIQPYEIDVFKRGDLAEEFDCLHDYLHFPERFSFFSIEFDGAKLKGHTFKVYINFSHPISSMSTYPNLFKLNCVPAVNLFQMTAEPIRIRNDAFEYNLNLDYDKRGYAKLYAIQAVQGLRKHRAEQIKLQDFHSLDCFDDRGCYYRLKQYHLDDDRYESRVEFLGHVPDDLYISCDVWACNGYYPGEFLQARDLYLYDKTVVPELKATNLTKPSQYYQSQFNSNKALDILSILNTTIEHFKEVHHIKKIFSLHEDMCNLHPVIESIQSVEIMPVQKFNHGIFEQGIKISLQCDARKREVLSEYHLLGELCHRIFQSFSVFNQKVETELVLWPKMKHYLWS